MNKEQKIKFVKDLIRVGRHNILKKIDKMPDEWDGIELRRYVADYFLVHVAETNKQRKKEYNNIRLVERF